MSCEKGIISSFCNGISVSIECLEKVLQGNSKAITLQLIDKDGFPLNLNDVSQIQILLYDARNLPIAKYYYPDVINASGITETSVIEEEFEINPEIDIWVDNLDITLLQISLSDDTSNTIIEQNNSNARHKLYSKNTIAIFDISFHINIPGMENNKKKRVKIVNSNMTSIRFK